MKRTSMSLKQPALAVAAIALCVAAVTAPASAQSGNCPELYNRVMGLYQTAPQSPEYSQMSNYYNSRCLGGSSAAVAYPDAYQQQYPAYVQPAYAQPVYVDPGAAIVTGAVIGEALSGGFDGNRDGRHVDGDRNHRRFDGDRRFR